MSVDSAMPEETAPACLCAELGKPASALAGEWFRIGLAALVAGLSMIFGLGVNLSPPEGEVRWAVHGVLAGMALLVLFLVGGALAGRAWKSLRRGRLAVEQLFVAGILGAMGASMVATLTGRGAIYYEVVAILLAVYTFGRLLGERRWKEVWREASRLEREYGTCLRLRPDGSAEAVPVSGVEAGERIRVPAGTGIGVDGVVVQGTALVRAAALTGEPFPFAVRPGSEVWAGSVVLDHMIEVEATAPGTQRRLDSLLAKLEEARRKPSGWQREADRVTQVFLPAVLGVAFATFVYWTCVGGLSAGLYNGLAVLLVACPCALGLATPLAIWSALNAMASRGVVGSSGEFVEKLAAVDFVVFDKTGTLSEGDGQVFDFVAAGDGREGWLREAVAAVQQACDHPMARAFHGWKPGRARVDGPVELLSGVGVAAEVAVEGEGRHRLEIGNDALAGGEESLVRSLREQLAGPVEGMREVWVRADGGLAGVARVRERLRDSAAQGLARLAEAGIEWKIMTGDAAAGARAAGLASDVEAGLSAEQKAEKVQALREDGHAVLFVGDGVNDAPAMAQADAGIALADGSSLALEAAGGHLFGTDLRAVATAVLIARAVKRSLRWNLVFAAVYNSVGIGLAALGWLHPVAAVVLMLASSATVTWRALRLEMLLSDWAAQDGGGNGKEWAGLVHLAKKKKTGPRRTARGAEPAGFLPARQVGWVVAAALAVQAPLMIYLGQLSGAWAWEWGGALLGLGLAVALGWEKLRGRLGLQMAAAMLGVGNLGMLLGWWADAGWQPLVRDGACYCGCFKSQFGLGLVAPWGAMHAGMLVFGFAGMLLVGEGVGSALLRRTEIGWHALWMTGGMLGGMIAGAMLLAPLQIGDPHRHFVLTYGAMSLGMLAGMYGACGLWRWRRSGMKAKAGHAAAPLETKRWSEMFE